MSQEFDEQAGQRPLRLARPGFAIHADRVGDQYVIVAAGELDHVNVEAVEAVVAQAAGTRDVVFELGEVTFVDSAGLRTLIQALRAVQPVQGRVVLRSPSPTLRRLLELTGLAEHFDIQP